MKISEKIRRDIDTLVESMRLDWQDLSKGDLSAQERAGIREHLDWCIKELSELRARLDEVSDLE
jgi:type VI protein secretion system component VasK